jgi:hypothetical protein
MVAGQLDERRELQQEFRQDRARHQGELLSCGRILSGIRTGGRSAARPNDSASAKEKGRSVPAVRIGGGDRHESEARGALSLERDEHAEGRKIPGWPAIRMRVISRPLPSSSIPYRGMSTLRLTGNGEAQASAPLLLSSVTILSCPAKITAANRHRVSFAHPPFGFQSARPNHQGLLWPMMCAGAERP